MAVTQEAVLMCFNCPVRKECDEYREATGSDFGMWAGVLQTRGD